MVERSPDLTNQKVVFIEIGSSGPAIAKTIRSWGAKVFLLEEVEDYLPEMITEKEIDFVIIHSYLPQKLPLLLKIAEAGDTDGILLIQRELSDEYADYCAEWYERLTKAGVVITNTRHNRVKEILEFLGGTYN